MQSDDGVQIGIRAANALTAAIFARPIMSNIFRGLYAQYLVAEILGHPWRTTDTWEAWDVSHPSGTKLEVKQSAARQDWHASEIPPKESAVRFDIRARDGFWEGQGIWRSDPGRKADLYVFAWHDGTNLLDTNHRDASQWWFYVCRSDALPNQKTISLGVLRKLAHEVRSDDLRDLVQRLANTSA
jgi:hypothetical protein